MTDREVLYNLIQQENSAAQRAKQPYLRHEHELITNIIAEISDKTVSYMVEALSDGHLWDKYKPKTPEDKTEATQDGKMEPLLWEIYLVDRADAQGKLNWPTMQEALSDVFQQKRKFLPMAQHPITNALADFFSLSEIMRNADGSISGSIGSGSNKIDFCLENETQHKIRTTALMLNDFLQQEYAKTHTDIVSIPFSAYAIWRKKDPANKKSVKALKEQAAEDLLLLSDISAQYKEKVNNNYVPRGRIRLNGGIAIIERDHILWSWNSALIPSLDRLAPVDMPICLGGVDPRGAAYELGRFIALQYRRNEGKANVEKIYISTLLSKTDKIPNIDNVSGYVRAGEKKIRERVIKALFNYLDEIEDLYYDVYTREGVYVDDPLQMQVDDFRNGYIIVDFSEYPKHRDRIENRDRRKKNLAKAKEKAINNAIAKNAAKKEVEKVDNIK